MSKRLIRSLAMIAIVLCTVFGGFLATQSHVAHAATACNVTYTVQNQWPGGFTASVSISNPGSTPINGWTLGFSFSAGQQISQGWNAAWSQSGANVTAQNLSYNSTIAANGSVSIGFNGSWTGSNPSPTSFTLNGSACNGGSGTTGPTVSITSPASGATFQAPATITIQASASDANSTITKVEFYNGATLLGTVTAAPYSFTWNGVAAGSYSLTAKAYAADGTSATSAAVSVTVSSSPTASVLTSAATLTVAPGGTVQVGVYLSTQPSGNVTVTSSISGASGVSIASGATLTFTTANWNAQQMVTVAASSSASSGSTATLTAAATGYVSATTRINVQGSSSGQKEPACAPGLPANTGTNYPTPNDPNGFGAYNQSIIGWEGNTYAPFAYLSGAFFARGVTASTYTAGGTSYCGAMYSFGVYLYGLNGGRPATGSVQWMMDNGYLPALTTSFTRNNVSISIKNFADNVTINGSPFEIVYSRVAVTNNGSSSVTVDPQPSSGLNALNSASNTVAAGQTVNHDYAVAVDSFGAGLLLPSGSALTGAIPSLDTAYSQMSSYWNGRLSVIPTLSLPNLTLPNTNNLSNPGTALINAYKSAFVYTRIIQVGTAPFSGANNYNAVFNHDAPGILVNRFIQGDFQDAHSLLLNARRSETNPYYYDGVLKTPWAWAVYLYETGDTSFVSQYFHDDASGSNSNGPSLYTQMHSIPSHLNSAGYIGVTGDNDSSGTWLFDDYSALLGLASYKYIATRIGNTTEATWADQQFTALLNNTNRGLTTNQQNNHINYLPCEVNVPDTADRCNAATDSNWAANTFFGQNAWNILQMGGNLNGILGDGTQIDNTYDFGYGRLKGVLPYPTCGAFTGYSTAYNTTYGEGALLGTKYRDLALTSYAWQIATTTSGPNAWWEAESSLSSNNPWAGSHANPEFGAIPYAWPLAGQTLALLNAIASQGFTTTSGGSSFSYTPVLYIGRGIPDTWIANGQTISISNYHVGGSSMGISISTTSSGGHRVVTVSFSGTTPSGLVSIGLPAFISSGVSQVQGGTYNASDHTVTATAGATSVVVTLNS